MGYPVFLEPKTIDDTAYDDGRQEDAPNGREVSSDGSQKAYQEFKAEAERLYARLKAARIYADEWFERIHDHDDERFVRLHLVMLCWEARDAGRPCSPELQFAVTCHFPAGWRFDD